ETTISGGFQDQQILARHDPSLRPGWPASHPNRNCQERRKLPYPSQTTTPERWRAMLAGQDGLLTSSDPANLVCWSASMVRPYASAAAIGRASPARCWARRAIWAELP